MTEPLNPDYCVNCQKCGKQFEMVWGQDNDVCEECEGGKRVNIPLVTFERPEEPGFFVFEKSAKLYVTVDGDEFCLTDLTAIKEFYANPENWRRFPIDEGTDANGSPVEQYFWIGDGGEFARTSSESDQQ